METLITLIVLIVIGAAVYRYGKRTGSRKGYHVGRTHGRWMR